jgi:hypothetical protein
MAEGIDTPPPASPPLAETSAAGAEKKPRKRFVGAKPGARAGVRRVANQVPDEILNDPALKAAMSGRYLLFSVYLLRILLLNRAGALRPPLPPSPLSSNPPSALPLPHPGPSAQTSTNSSPPRQLQL